MEKKKAPPKTIDEYIAQFPPDAQNILASIRCVIHATAPDITPQ